MPKTDDVSFYNSMIAISKSKLKDALDRYKHNYGLYSSKEAPQSKICESVVEPINSVYPLIEMNKVELGFKYPEVITKAKRKFFFVRRVRGESNREIISPNDKPEIFLQMNEMNLKKLEGISEVGSDPMVPDVVDYFIIDGHKAAQLFRTVLNNYIDDKGVEREFEKIKNDALIAKAGVIWIDFYSSNHIPANENEYTKVNDVCVHKLILGKTFLYDTTIDNIDEIHQAKWIARRHFIPKADLEALKNVTMADGSPLFIPEAIDKLKGSSSEKTVNTGAFADEDLDIDNSTTNSITNPNGVANLREDERICGYNFWQVWARPSLTEQMDQTNDFNRGKVFYICEGNNEKVSNEIPWPWKTDEFPCEVLAFNYDPTQQTPPSDIEIYEPLLSERNVYKAIQRDAADAVTRIKTIINNASWNNVDANSVLSRLKDKNNQFIVASGSTPNDFFQFKLTTPPEIWNISNMIQEDIDKASLTSAAKFGQVTSRASATGYAISDRAASARSQYRQYIYAMFCRKCISKIAALMQQYYDRPRVIQLSGDLNAEWVEYTREDIQGEYLFDVDIMSMNPNDIAFQTQRSIDILNLALGMFNNPMSYLKILSEGRMINISEIFNEILKRIDIGNEKIFPEVPEDVRMFAEQTLTAKLQVPQSAQAMGSLKQNPDVTGGGSTNEGAVGGGGMPPGDTAQPGGKPKVGMDAQMPPTQGNNGGGRE